MSNENNFKSGIKALEKMVIGIKKPERNVPIYGRLIDVDGNLITIEKVDGTITILNLNFVDSVWPTKNQPRAGC